MRKQAIIPALLPDQRNRGSQPSELAKWGRMPADSSPVTLLSVDLGRTLHDDQSHVAISHEHREVSAYCANE